MSKIFTKKEQSWIDKFQKLANSFPETSMIQGGAPRRCEPDITLYIFRYRDRNKLFEKQGDLGGIEPIQGIKNIYADGGDPW
jgi:hypothetical protein